MFERHSSAFAQHSQSGVSQFIGCRPFRVADRGVTADTIRSVMLPQKPEPCELLVLGHQSPAPELDTDLGFTTNRH